MRKTSKQAQNKATKVIQSEKQLPSCAHSTSGSNPSPSPNTSKGKSPSPQQSQSQRLVQLKRENELLREQHRRRIEEARNQRNLLTVTMDVAFGVIKREALLDQIGHALIKK